MDSIPLVAITANVGVSLLGKDSFQEIDIAGITTPITKYSFIVKDVTKLADTVREAFALARSGRPGPVVIDITRDVTSAECDYEPLPLEQHAASGHLASLIRRAYTSSLKMPEADLDDVEKLVEMIAESKKPMLICGGGVVRSRAHEEFRQFVRRIDAPVAITVMGGGGVSGRDVMTTGMIGMHGSVASNMACDNCDLLIAVGCRFSDRVALKPETFAHQAKIVHIDIDRAEINKNVQTDHHIIGDAKQVLNLLLERLPQYEHKEWKDFVLSFPRETEYGESESVLTPKQVLSAIARKCPQDSIVATDVGQHQMWAIQHLHFDYPGQLLTSGGFGTMGFGLGAAIGAKMGNPDKRVVHVTGDGCFRMNCHELCTVEHYGLPIISVVFNNGTLGMVRQWQNLIYQKRFSQTDLDRGPDFVRLAEAYGATLHTIDIKASVNQHFEDIGHSWDDHTVTFENSQARTRTLVLMDLANKLGGLVIGTGDLSELALGWATYNGDHMSMYGVNGSIPKTLVRYLTAYEAAHSPEDLKNILLDVLNTPVSPELLPPKDGEISQKTEELVGPYELHDFYLYYMVRFGYSPRKIFRIARIAFDGVYDDETIKKWLVTFVRRFFIQQFKRSCLPDGPKVGSVTLSPRGDWRMPSDAVSELWLSEAESL